MGYDTAESFTRHNQVECGQVVMLTRQTLMLTVRFCGHSSVSNDPTTAITKFIVLKAVVAHETSVLELQNRQCYALVSRSFRLVIEDRHGGRNIVSYRGSCDTSAVVRKVHR